MLCNLKLQGQMQDVIKQHPRRANHGLAAAGFSLSYKQHSRTFSCLRIQEILTHDPQVLRNGSRLPCKDNLPCAGYKIIYLVPGIPQLSILMSDMMIAVCFCFQSGSHQPLVSQNGQTWVVQSSLCLSYTFSHGVCVPSCRWNIHRVSAVLLPLLLLGASTATLEPTQQPPATSPEQQWAAP